MKFSKYLCAAVVAVCLPVAAKAQYFTMPGTYSYGINTARHVMDLSPDGKLGVTLTDRVIVFDPLTGAQLDTKTSAPGSLGIYLAQTSLGLRVAVLTGSDGPRQIAVFDLSSAGKLTQLGTSTLSTSSFGGGSGVVLSGAGQVGFVNVLTTDGMMNDLVAFSLVDGSIIRRTTMLAGGEMGISEAGGKRTLAILKNSTASAQWFDVTDPTAQPNLLGDVPLTLNHSGNGGPLRSLVFSGDGRYLFVADLQEFFSVIDTTSKQVISSINDNQSFVRLRMFEDGQRRLIVLEAMPFFGQNSPFIIRLVDATDPAHLLSLSQINVPAGVNTIRGDLAFSRDASRLYVPTATGLVALSLPSLSTIWQQTGPVGAEHQIMDYVPTDEPIGAWDGPSGAVIAFLPANPPSINISDTSVTEGDTLNVSADFTVTLSAPSTHRVTISYATSGLTAQSGFDYITVSGTTVFEAGQTSKTISVPVVGDLNDEVDETFNLNLSNPTAAFLTTSKATATILDNDPPPTLMVNGAAVLEGNSGTRNVTVFFTLSVASTKQISVDYATAAGTATAGTDYTSKSGTLTYSPGQVGNSVTFACLPDTVVEPDEFFSITFSNAVNIIPSNPAKVIIVNDDIPGGNPIDLSGFFVYEQYGDFLNRQPDPDGFNFWVNNINQCGTDPACTEVQRLNTSGAFFLSIEFQQTGYLVERFYKCAFGDSPGTSNLNGGHQISVPFVRFNDFVSDSLSISSGVVVNAPGWEQLLEQHKQTFAEAFVNRFPFLTEFPTNMTPAAFVEKLNTRAGNPLSTNERNQLVSDLTTNAKTRAQVVRTVAEHPTVVSAEFNRAFVLMQYFGYLHRNPNDAPDSDYTGYDFWLTKLNQFNGNYIAAEMVKAFLSSPEYRKRFGP